jgi:nifR3 family TIM-barrel protein
MYDDLLSLKNMHIGKVELTNRLVLAPMAGVTDFAYRLINRRQGCGLAFSEMLSATALGLRHRKTLVMAAAHPEERPVALQLFGADEQHLAAAAAILTELGADIIDLNCGCPVRKVVKGGAGAALMRDPARIARLVSAMRRATDLPLTVKLRSGWDAASINAPLVARVAEEAGADAITIHPRTAVQGFSGRADWDIIAQVKRAVAIPVIGNGDVSSPHDPWRMMAETGCDAVMIGRATLGNPWLFAQALAVQAGRATDGRSPVLPTVQERREVALEHFLLLSAGSSTHAAFVNFRRCLMWYSRGLPRSGAFREAVSRQGDVDELRGELERYFDSVEESLAA